MRFACLSGLLMLLAAALAPELARAVVAQNHYEELGDPYVAADVAAEPVAGPFEFPWSLAFLPDGAPLVTERAGRLQLVKPGVGAAEIAGLPDVLYHDQAGLLDVAVDPGFEENQTVYLSYVHGTTSSSTVRVLKARLDREGLQLTDQQVIFESTPAPITQLYGGRIAVTADGYLFLTLGDRWEPESAQDLARLSGKIVRLRVDGSVPGDNPFVARPEAKPEIWSYGHRNPQGLAFDPLTGDLWSHEHGPLGGDELNLIRKGRNYGWPVITHGLDYSGKPIGEGTAKDGMEQPFQFWTPSIAPSGLAIESTDHGAVLWIGALAGEALVMLETHHGELVHEQRLLPHELGRIRDVRVSPDGRIYLLTDSATGGLYRLLEPAVEQASRRATGKRRL